jgi:hypothetical protein
MTDAFCAFAHWPRSARYTVMWGLILLVLSMAIPDPEQPPPVLEIQWARIADAAPTDPGPTAMPPPTP